MLNKLEGVPQYDELPVLQGAPPGSSWGVWGSDDQLGTLNLLNDERTLRAMQHVRRGQILNLGLPIEEPRRDETSIRANPVHRILRVGSDRKLGFVPDARDDISGGAHSRDDYLEKLWLQGSSQWDGLGCYRHVEYGNYNGFPDEAIHTEEGASLGVDKWAKRGIVGRGVLADVVGYFAEIGKTHDPLVNVAITVADIENTLERQGSTVEVGDILLVRTGWVERFLSHEDSERERLMSPAHRRNAGLENSEEMVSFLWNLHIAAVAADNITVEACPSVNPIDIEPSAHIQPGVSRLYMHSRCLPLLGMPLGELFVLDALADVCASDGDYAFLLVSVPLNVRGGLGTPAQVVAIK